MNNHSTELHFTIYHSASFSSQWSILQSRKYKSIVEEKFKVQNRYRLHWISISQSKKEFRTHAMLDCYSQGTFISTDLARKLKAECVQTTIKIKTLDGEEIQETEAVSGLKVSKSSGKSMWIDLPVTYTKEDLPGWWWRCCNTRKDQEMGISGKNCWWDNSEAMYLYWPTHWWQLLKGFRTIGGHTKWARWPICV